MLMESLPWIKSFNKILSTWRILAMIDKEEKGREEDPFDPIVEQIYIYIYRYRESGIIRKMDD